MPDEAKAELYQCLAATAERPVDRTPSRLLDEAQAVADDLRAIDDSAVVADRAGVVVELLSKIDGMGDPETDEAVARARELTEALATE
ncbi:hypothetical protein D3D02_17830 [Halobellus sp. Atlit-38R]|uniref:hypothetical protein n=1 Tax=Halobellus sp. Atlit-38R TaxID=2282131 RepID=UPI000EF26200|nr:hypothetical protein [Halobellus sp. Atlit-38R]RLM83532.1 hypothetical protein D3D02_17830 [Halobellus sp. Atlit-38R]